MSAKITRDAALREIRKLQRRVNDMGDELDELKEKIEISSTNKPKPKAEKDDEKDDEKDNDDDGWGFAEKD